MKSDGHICPGGCGLKPDLLLPCFVPSSGCPFMACILRDVNALFFEWGEVLAMRTHGSIQDTP